MELKVGQEVFMCPIGNNARYGNNKIIKNTIKKVGKKYFYLDGYERTKFNISDLQEVTDYSTNWRIYLSLQEIEDEKEFYESIEFIRRIIDRYGKPKLTLDQVRKIRAIIEGRD